jgi:2-dehydro-3-deoxygluconokinase
MAKIVCFGECMMELSKTVLGGKSWSMGYAGDSYNVAVYIQRLGLPTSYMTAIGKDEFSEEMLAEWQDEGVDTTLVLRHPDRIAGLYAIRVDDDGERTFTYWRSQSAAREFFACPGADAAMARAGRARLLYVSGITLSLFDRAGRGKVMELARSVRQNGGQVAFDTNYRPKGWPDQAEARDVFTAFGRLSDIVLPTLDDDRSLFGDTGSESCAGRWLGLGAKEVAVKLGAEGAYVATQSEHRQIAARAVHKVKDTTGAGDAFNAAYLAHRHAGKDEFGSAEAATVLAATVVQSAGAILPRVLMPLKRLG